MNEWLRFRVIPQGFLLHHSPSDLNNSSLIASTQKMLTQASDKLMIVHIKTLQHKQIALTQEFTHFKTQLSSFCPHLLLNTLK